MRAMFLSMLLLLAAASTGAGELVENVTTDFEIFGDVLYVQHTGRFIGTTSSGAFRMPYQIIVPADPALGNGTVVVEAPHSSFGNLGRDFILGRELLFENGFRWATVGWGTVRRQVLDRSADDLILGGVAMPPGGDPSRGLFDEEVLIQFTKELRTHPLVAPVSRVYGYGFSQTADAIQEILHGPFGRGVFDLSLLHVALWRAPFVPPTWDHIWQDEFQPVSGVGRVVYIGSEGDQIISDAEQFARAAHRPDYRVYEVAGAAHGPSGSNPTDHFAVMRAIFVAADLWARSHVAPPPSTLLKRTQQDPDPVYGFFTGIARDGDSNAIGGVRLPDVAVGRAQFIAADLTAPPGIFGATVDLSCEPRPRSPHDGPRFESHRDYVRQFAKQLLVLRQHRFVLPDDAMKLLDDAIQSDVGVCP